MKDYILTKEQFFACLAIVGANKCDARIGDKTVAELHCELMAMVKEEDKAKEAE